MYDEGGKPTNSTNTATISIDLESSSSYSGEGYSSSSNLSELENMTVSGVAGFIMGTGSLIVNGTETLESSHTYSYDSESGSSILNYSFTVSDFKLSPQVNYPAGGSITFTIVMEDTSPGEEIPGYNIPGSATFNGTNMVAVKFAGYDYQLDLNLYR